MSINTSYSNPTDVVNNEIDSTDNMRTVSNTRYNNANINNFNINESKLTLSSRLLQPMIAPSSWNRFMFDDTNRRKFLWLVAIVSLFFFMFYFISAVYPSLPLYIMEICYYVICFIITLLMIVHWIDVYLLKLVLYKFQFLYLISQYIFGLIISSYIVLNKSSVDIPMTIQIIRIFVLNCVFFSAFTSLVCYDALSRKYFNRKLIILLLFLGNIFLHTYFCTIQFFLQCMVLVCIRFSSMPE